MNIFSLFGSIAIDSKDAEKSIDGIEKKGKGFASSLDNLGKKAGNAGKSLSLGLTTPILAVGAGILGLATKAGATADRLLDLRDITGLSTSTIQEYQYVAKMAGVSTEAVTAATEGLVKSLPKLTTEGNATGEAFKALGVDLNGTSEQIMNDMIVALAGMDDPLERNQLGAKAFGGAWKDMAPILGMGAEGIDKAREEARKLGLVMSEDALVGANNFRISMDKLKAQMGGVFNEIGAKLAPILTDVLLPAIEEKLIPAIGKMTDFVVKLIDWFSNLDGTTQKIILVIVGLVAAIGPMLLILAKVISIVKICIVTFKAVALVIAGITLPIGLAIAGVVALIAIGVLLYKNWDEVMAWANKMWGYIKHIFEQMKNGISNAITAIINTFTNMKNSISNAMSGVRDTVSNILDTIFGKFKSIGDRIKDTFVGSFNGLRNLMKAPLNGILTLLNGLGNNANKVITAMNKVPGVKLPMIPKIPMLATGTNYVPHDMLAMIHKGEAVVPKKYNPHANGEGSNKGGDTYNEYKVEVSLEGVVIKDRNDIDYLAEQFSQKLGQTMRGLGEKSYA